MSENMAPKQLMIISAMIDMLRLFADNEIGGQYEINFDKLCNYIDSIRCVSDYFECDTEEDVYNKFTEDIYNGLPVWRFLILPKWTANMVEKSFNAECQNEYKQMEKTYKCLTCKYFKEQKTIMGILPKCTYDAGSGRTDLRRTSAHKPFNIKKRCKNYEKGEPIRKH